ncbi:uncharacterized protein LOC110739836 [Chenopodium quinoa]|uniref:uncharacterized protein LOC110739836 n=1 Tax=Chenopodium quinoa TaxID=63459 RepID=UPI000B789611|nr:uncharacterized protein LOC110739836 [Chenopodium quinoa]
MDGSMSMGVMAVFAVSGSVALLALQVHNRLLSDFMKKIDFEFGCGKCQCKRRIQFADNVQEPLPIKCEKESSETNPAKPCCERSYNGEGTMPLNRLALYRGIIKNKMSFPKSEYRVSRGRNVLYVHTNSY